MSKTRVSDSTGGPSSKDADVVVGQGVRAFLTSDLTTDVRDELFRMYVDVYGNAGQDLWFKKAGDLAYYPRGYLQMAPSSDQDTGSHKIVWFVLYQTFAQANKISLLVHNGTVAGKQMLFDHLALLLVTKGHILEASGAPSHILRTRYRIFPMSDQSDIEYALDAHAKGYGIRMNAAYRVGSADHVYERTTGDFVNRECLFGRICNHAKQQWLKANFQQRGCCDRQCVYEENDDEDQ
jgi:hypothetical protein